MERLCLLTDYGRCDGCGKCVSACLEAHGAKEEHSGVKISVSGPFTLPSGKRVAYYIATPTDFCDACRTCAAACPSGCIAIGSAAELGEKLTSRNMALFTLKK